MDATNIFQLLENAAASHIGMLPKHGIFVDLPAGLVRDVTEFSKYEPECNHEDSELDHSNEGLSNSGSETEKGRASGEETAIEPENNSDESDIDLEQINPNNSKNCAKCASERDANIKNQQQATYPVQSLGLITYKSLLASVQQESAVVQSLMAMHSTNVFLLYTDNDMDSIHWFWSVVCAGGLPCLLTKLPEDEIQGSKQITNLKETLKDPIILTSKNLIEQFKDIDGLIVWTFGQIDKGRERFLSRRPPPPDVTGTGKFEDFNGLSMHLPGHKSKLKDVAVLVLTSGSTGASKAVELTNYQILSSVLGKSVTHKTSRASRFLNWIRFDHVAHLVEIHLHSLLHGATQVTIPSEEVLTDPVSFLRRIHKHRISYTFAPNFFLGMLLQNPSALVGRFLDLSSLRSLVSGGEANIVETCQKLTECLSVFGVSESFICPGFGMTETCAGAIYNAVDCPQYDRDMKNEFACLGECVPGVQMRISEDGELQLQGSVVFTKYHNNEEATRVAFTEDGWFRTGDLGVLDDYERLNLTGREKDMVIIAGINHYPQAIESAIEDAKVPGVTPTYTIVFASRQSGSDTESLIVVYLPEVDSDNAMTRTTASTLISKAVVTYCGIHPAKIVPLDKEQLQKSSLGKISRSRVRESFEKGDLDKYIQQNDEITAASMSSVYEPASTATEKLILQVFSTRSGAASNSIGVSHDLFDLGASSLDILSLKVDLQKSLGIGDIPLATFFSQSKVSDLAVALDRMRKIDNNQDTSVKDLPTTRKDIQECSSGNVAAESAMSVYDPVVILNPRGTKTPIFFFHPGVGEVMIFLNISRYFTDRPVYALRARGFDGEPFFKSMNEIYITYLAAIKRMQPRGPYHFVGYSFGSVLAFEITKILQYLGEEVKFLATIDQPPFFKARAQSYDWYECVLTLAFFLDFLPEKLAYAVLPIMCRHQHNEVLEYIFSKASKERVEELDMTYEKLDNWANLALQLKKCVSDWEPEGKVKHMDVFYCEPLIGIVKAKDITDWRENYIMKWSAFVEDGGVAYHEVGGTHRTLISPPNLASFWKEFKRVMDERGA